MVARASMVRVAIARIAMARIAMARIAWRGCDGEDYTLRKLFTITAAVGGR